MAARGVLVRSFNLRSRNRLRKPAQGKVTPKKKIISTNPSTIEKCSDPSSHDTTKAVSTRRQLRPRKAVDKNANEETFKESSKNVNQQSQRHPKGRKNTFKLKKVDETKQKLPVYKNTNTEKSLEDQNSVYDFTFDPNDTQEKIAKKKPKKGRTNKRNAKTTQNKDKKDKKKPTNTQILKKETLPDVTVVEQKEEKKKKLLNEEKKTKTIKKSTKTPRIDIHAVEDKTSPRMPQLVEQEENCVKENGENDSKKEQIDIHTAEENISSDTTLVEQSKTSNKGTPRIISIENANAIKVNRVSNTPTESFRSPLRPRNVFHNTAVTKQQRTSNYSFLTESLSPISNTADAVNIGSPWRPPVLPMFSQAKYFIQSTPKVMQSTVSSKISKKPLVTQDKENKQAIKKKVLVRKNKLISKNKAVNSKELVEQENQENKLFVEDKEDCQVMDSEAVKESEQLVQNKGENEKPADQENKHLAEYLNFSDTFDVLSDSEKRSTFGTEIRLFEDIEPTHFPEVCTHFFFYLKIIILFVAFI